MSRIAASLLVLFALAAPAWAADEIRPVAQVPLLPLAEEVPADIDTLIRTLWRTYYNTGAESSFGRDSVRVGRVDLDGDGSSELVLMIDAPAWEAGPGSPFVVTQWRNKRWVPVGWGWGDEDTVFATTEVLGGWRSIDTGKLLLRWVGREYRYEEKPQ
ncbi:MAG TPA: hypothetical protein VK196_05110 [Magnetospirillum sp.]|nr:hypothetical protein [Magnetospirillum sp.]